MARISTYQIDDVPTLDDKVIGTDANQFNATKNYKIGDILSLAGEGYLRLSNNRMYYGDADNVAAETSSALLYLAGAGISNSDVVAMNGSLFAYVTHPESLSSVGIGRNCLLQSNTINNTTALGIEAGGNTGGENNTFIGFYAGRFSIGSTPSNQNTALGAFALSSDGGTNYGDGNTALGFNALKTLGVQGGIFNATFNTAVGANALHLCQGGEFNVAIGNDALFNLTNAKNNTAIGKAAGSTNTIFWNTTCLGHNSQAQASDEVVLGDNDVTTLRCNTQVISTLSDARDKSQVEELSVGIDFLMDVRPVKWVWSRRDGSFANKVDSGFIAQELDDARIAHNAEDVLHNLVNKANPDAWASGQAALIPVLVKAIQELKTEIDSLKQQLLN
jgi:hypothetical protein